MFYFKILLSKYKLYQLCRLNHLIVVTINLFFLLSFKKSLIQFITDAQQPSSFIDHTLSLSTQACNHFRVFKPIKLMSLRYTERKSDDSKKELFVSYGKLSTVNKKFTLLAWHYLGSVPFLLFDLGSKIPSYVKTYNTGRVRPAVQHV